MTAALPGQVVILVHVVRQFPGPGKTVDRLTADFVRPAAPPAGTFLKLANVPTALKVVETMRRGQEIIAFTEVEPAREYIQARARGWQPASRLPRPSR